MEKYGRLLCVRLVKTWKSSERGKKIMNGVKQASGLSAVCVLKKQEPELNSTVF